MFVDRTDMYFSNDRLPLVHARAEVANEPDGNVKRVRTQTRPGVLG